MRCMKKTARLSYNSRVIFRLKIKAIFIFAFADVIIIENNRGVFCMKINFLACGDHILRVIYSKENGAVARYWFLPDICKVLRLKMKDVTSGVFGGELQYEFVPYNTEFSAQYLITDNQLLLLFSKLPDGGGAFNEWVNKSVWTAEECLFKDLRDDSQDEFKEDLKKAEILIKELVAEKEVLRLELEEVREMLSDKTKKLVAADMRLLELEKQIKK